MRFLYARCAEEIYHSKNLEVKRKQTLQYQHQQKVNPSLK